MHIRSLVLSISGSAVTASFLATFIITTFFTEATATHHHGHPRARKRSFFSDHFGIKINNKTISNITQSNTTANDTYPWTRAINSAQSIIHHESKTFLPADTCLFYSLSLHQEAKTYAHRHNLTTIWDIYPNQTFPQIQNFTDPERRVFYGRLDRAYAQRCVGKAWTMPLTFCNNSLLNEEEISAYDHNETRISTTYSIPGPYNGSDFVRPHGIIIPGWYPDLNDTAVVQKKCDDPERFKGQDPFNYWGN